MQSTGEYKLELRQELLSILSYWMRFAPDPVYGGFYGRIDHSNQVYPESPRGVVMCSNILWSFAAAYNSLQDEKYLAMANLAYDYIVGHFLDPTFGGVYWNVDFRGRPADTRKQIFAQAFCIFGLSEFYKSTRRQEVLELAVQLYRWTESHGFDPQRKGYFEAFARDGSPVEEPDPGREDRREEKTMNTHLRLLEAYAHLFGVWKNAGLRSQIEKLLEVFAHHMVDERTRHIHLFFDAAWNGRSDLICYGHEMHAAWLLPFAAEAIMHPGWMMTMKSLATKIADAAAEGLDDDGGLNFESERNRVVREKHWWPQAEAMIGFYNAYQASGEERYLNKSLASWQFVKSYIRDPANGEWFWGVDASHGVLMGHDKAGLWKTPYHNTRACLELIRRMEPEGMHPWRPKSRYKP